jgi:hypothetical protein
VETEELTLSEETAREAAKRERRAMRERIQASIVAFERAIPVIKQRVETGERTITQLRDLQTASAMLPDGVQGSQSVLLFRGTDSRQSINDAKLTLLDLLGGTIVAQQGRHEILAGELAKAEQELERLRAALVEYSE